MFEIQELSIFFSIWRTVFPLPNGAHQYPRCQLQRPPISDDVISAYRSANYRVESSGETFILHIDQYSEALSRLLRTSGYHCAAFVTACHPWGKLQSSAT